jgi:hypothetical protein
MRREQKEPKKRRRQKSEKVFKKKLGKNFMMTKHVGERPGDIKSR